jgi:hypothetical protein
MRTEARLRREKRFHAADWRGWRDLEVSNADVIREKLYIKVVGVP